MENAIRIGGETIARGERRRTEIPVARLPTETWLSLPVEVVCGKHEGPALWLSGAVHGDELNGVEIIRRVLEKVDPARLRGTLIAAPIVNVYGFIHQSRYLPDRRDLNRSFPGSHSGSLAARLASLFMSEVVSRCTHGIDLHTGSNHRHNLPQVRANLHDAETRRCAEAFGAPVMVHSQVRDGSLRQAAAKQGKTALVYEAGEPLRFDSEAIETGLRGVLRVMTALGMRGASRTLKPRDTVEASDSSWVRARRSGIVHLQVELGAVVRKGQILAEIADAFGDDRVTVKAPFDGLVVGQSKNPLVHQGDAVVHLATVAGAND